MSTKSFSDAKKPERRPTPEEIAAFEETGRSIASKPMKSAKPETRENGNTENRIADNTETSVSAKADIRQPENTESRGHSSTIVRDHGNTEASKTGDTDARPAEATVRLTIDLPESVHTRFKAACASTRRKMVDEVRKFIERRTAELESDLASRR